MTFTISSAYQHSPFKDKYSHKKYKDILLSFFYELSKYIIYERGEFRLPLGGGVIRIIKVKLKKNKTLDYKHFNLTGEKRFLLNRHTNGYYFMWHWITKRCKYKNCKLYKMIPNRGNDKVIGKRGLAKHIIDCANDPYKRDYDVLPIR